MEVDVKLSDKELIEKLDPQFLESIKKQGVDLENFKKSASEIQSLSFVSNEIENLDSSRR